MPISDICLLDSPTLRETARASHAVDVPAHRLRHLHPDCASAGKPRVSRRGAQHHDVGHHRARHARASQSRETG